MIKKLDSKNINELIIESNEIKELEIIVTGEITDIKNELDKLYFINRIILGNSFLNICTTNKYSDKVRKYILTVMERCIIPRNYEQEIIKSLRNNCSTKLNVEMIF